MSDPTLSARQSAAKYTYGTWRRQKGWKPAARGLPQPARTSPTATASATSTSRASSCARTSATTTRRSSRPSSKQAEELAFVSAGLRRPPRARSWRMSCSQVLPQGARRSSSSPPRAPRPTRPRSRSRACTPASTRSSRATPSYHGSTSASIALTGDFRRWPVDGADTVPGDRVRARRQLLPLPARSRRTRELRRRLRRLRRVHDRARGQRRGDHRRAGGRHERRPGAARRATCRACARSPRSTACCSSVTRS